MMFVMILCECGTASAHQKRRSSKYSQKKACLHSFSSFF
jgi:hypothetical protein